MAEWFGRGAVLVGVVVAAAFLVWILLGVGTAGANWVDGDREDKSAECAALAQECGAFCLYPTCLECNDCS